MPLTETQSKIIKWSLIAFVTLLILAGIIVGIIFLAPKGVSDVIIKPVVSIGKILNPGSPKSKDLNDAIEVVNGIEKKKKERSKEKK